ncbi:hypothetical protein RJ639_019820 [Escallonia herrerae]|uniref:Pentatricopeptide repeat-containing protein n=1 Tax=Escallonia herrerae TaxID=1293975 RepID=A0AA88VAB1_9ASTE|nr:hypothetical protein RJ639_019820 [Escallonia herrerae]
MQSVFLPSKSIPPTPIPINHDTLSNLPPKPSTPTLSISAKPGPAITEAHLNHLCRTGRLPEAISALDSISQSGSKLRPTTLTRLIQSCIDTNSIQLGRQLHGRFGLLSEVDLHVRTKLVGMYAKCGCLEDARKVFDEMPERNLFTWLAMIGACARERRWREVLELYGLMMEDGIVPDGFLLPKILQACGNCGDVAVGEVIHSLVVRGGLDCEMRVQNSLLAVYAKCGRLSSARRFFDGMEGKDSVSWNSIITGYCRTGEVGEARRLFELMAEEGVERGLVTWNILIARYNQLGSCDVALGMMKEMEGFGITPDVVTWTSVISGFAQNIRRSEALDLFREMLLAGNGDEDEATDLFQRMEKDGTIKRDTASWNALIAGYLQNGQKNKALGVFRQMQSLGVTPNSVTILSILPACANLVAAKKVREIQCCMLRRNLESEMSVLNSIIDTYAKAGNIVYSKSIFDRLLTKDIISWNTMMTGFVLHGCSGEALALYDRMRELGIEPNRGTFVPLISAYGLAKLVNEGERVFSSMTEDYNIIPYLDHCAAMVEIYGRSGRLEEAVQFIEDMGVEPETSIWGALLTACMVHGNIRLAVLAGERLHELEPRNAMIQQLILQTNALGEPPEDSVKVKSPDKRNNTKHSLGQSWMERKNIVHSFVAGDHCQPDAEVFKIVIFGSYSKTFKCEDVNSKFRRRNSYFS